MKKHLLFLTIGTLLLGGLAFLTKPKVNDVKAYDNNMHFFIQVESKNDLRIGDKVFIGTPGGTIFHSLAGNPVYSCGSHIGGRNEDGTKYFTCYGSDYQEVLLMEVETGAYSDTYSFRSIRSDAQEEDYSHPTRGRYLAYGHEYHDKKYSNIQAYGDINMADGKGQYTSWTLEFRGTEHYAIMKYYGEKFDTHIQWVYYGSSARNNFGYYTGKTDIFLYKEITAEQGGQGFNLAITSEPDQMTVYEGDYLDLTGTALSITIDGGTLNSLTFTSTYEIDHDLYTVSPAGESGVENVIHCSYGPWNFVLHAEIIKDTSDYTYFNEAKTQKGDYRGNYVIVYQNGASITQLKRDTWAFNYNKESPDGPIHNKLFEDINDITKHSMDIVHSRINGTSYMFLKSLQGNYLVRNGQSIDFSNSADINSAITIDSNLNIHVGDGILYWSDYDFQVDSNPSANSRAKLYKRMIDYTALGQGNTNRFETFITNFTSVTGNGCDVSGDTDTTITFSEWNGLASNFDDIANDVCGYDFQGYLANMTYVHNGEKGTGSIKDLIDRYDYIVTKYQDSKGFDDFMDRKLGSAYQVNYVAPSVSLNEMMHINSDDTIIYVIAIICSISLVGFASFYFVKRRKHQ